MTKRRTWSVDDCQSVTEFLKLEVESFFSRLQPRKNRHLSLKQCFSTFLMLQSFDNVLHVVVTPTHKIIFAATS